MKPVERRKKELQKHKNFSLTFLLVSISWFSFFSLIYFIEPKSPFALPVFFIILFISLFFTLSVLLVSKRRGLIISIAILSFLLLSYFDMGHLLNLILIVAIAIISEIYLTKK